MKKPPTCGDLCRPSLDIALNTFDGLSILFAHLLTNFYQYPPLHNCTVIPTSDLQSRQSWLDIRHRRQLYFVQLFVHCHAVHDNPATVLLSLPRT
jgi:hypothetical protein